MDKTRFPSLVPFFVGLGVLFSLTGVVRSVDPPGILNHQGRVSVNGVNHEGAGFFKFALVNAAGNATYWSNDATSSGGSQPTAAVETPVTSGHYSLPLGDTTYHAKMTNAIPKAVFVDNADVRLCIWFSEDNTTFQKLSPNRRIASAAYALSSGPAGVIASGAIGSDQIADGSITGLDLLSGTVTSTQLGAGSVTGGKIADSQVMTSHLVADAVTGAKIADATITGADIAAGAIDSTRLAANSVTANQIADGQVFTAELAANAVTSAKIADGTIVKADLDSSIGVWDSGGGNVYRTTGNIGIGTANPAGLLEIQGEAVLGAEALDQEVLTPVVTSEVLWQSFTAGPSGQLTRLELKVGTPLGTASSTGTIRIFAGEGNTGTVLSTQSVTFAVVPAGSYQSFVLTSTVALTAGAKYTIGIEVPSSILPWMFIDTGNPYAGGMSSNAAWDLGFRTYVTPVSSETILTVRGGKVGIGMSLPTSKLHVVGGATFTSGSAGANQSVSWAPGSASWSFTSDRNTKEGIIPVDPETILKRLTAVPIAEWNYIGYDQRHIGPMAQDFHAAFPLTQSNTSLNDADLHGVALAAIQGLNLKIEDRDMKREQEAAGLREENAELKKRLESLEIQMGRLLENEVSE